MQRNMRSRVGKVDKKRLASISAHELKGLVRISGIEGGLVRVDFHHLVTVHQRQVWKDVGRPAGSGMAVQAGYIGARARGGQARVFIWRLADLGMEGPHVIGVRKPEELVEAMLHGEKLRRVAQMPLSEYASGIASGLEGLGQGGFVGINAKNAVREHA